LQDVPEVTFWAAIAFTGMRAKQMAKRVTLAPLNFMCTPTY
jgi:hypothetical protein